MKKIIYPANNRGVQDHGWLKAAHSFSFGNYYDPRKMHFGLLRVLNDDMVAAGRGFGMHPHDNMEIVTIPLSGVLSHQDSIGSQGTVSAGEVQIMSAGTGISHAEFNGSTVDPVNLLQIWVFPRERNIAPRYAQARYDLELNRNTLVTVVSPENVPGILWINQYAWFSLGQLEESYTLEYIVNRPGNGVYVFIIEGSVEIDGHVLGERDAVGIYDTQSFKIFSTQESKLLVIDVPME